MGIGLSICRTIVQAHGGRIWIEAGAKGGTAIHFTLPSGESKT
jgi:two-component system sensor kinase FixL